MVSITGKFFKTNFKDFFFVGLLRVPNILMSIFSLKEGQGLMYITLPILDCVTFPPLSFQKASHETCVFWYPLWERSLQIQIIFLLQKYFQD